MLILWLNKVFTFYKMKIALFRLLIVHLMLIFISMSFAYGNSINRKNVIDSFTGKGEDNDFPLTKELVEKVYKLNNILVLFISDNPDSAHIIEKAYEKFDNNQLFLEALQEQGLAEDLWSTIVQSGSDLNDMKQWSSIFFRIQLLNRTENFMDLIQVYYDMAETLGDDVKASNMLDIDNNDIKEMWSVCNRLSRSDLNFGLRNNLWLSEKADEYHYTFD